MAKTATGFLSLILTIAIVPFAVPTAGADEIPFLEESEGSDAELFVNHRMFAFDFGALKEQILPTRPPERPAGADETDPQLIQLAFDPQNTIEFHWGWDLFAQDPASYDINLALAALTLCQAAKTSESSVDAHLKDLGFENIRSEYYGNLVSWHNPASTFASRAVLLNGERKVIVAIVVRGTDNAGDFFTDLSSVFDGFARSAANVAERFESYYRHLSSYYGFDVNADNTILFITGHSLGGAVAGQLAEQLEKSSGYRETIFCYAFASPQYKASDEREQFANIHNIINIQDPWPYLPFGFEKNGNLWYYDSSESQYQPYLDEIYDTSGWEAKSIEDRHDPPTYLAMMLANPFIAQDSDTTVAQDAALDEASS